MTDPVDVRAAYTAWASALELMTSSVEAIDAYRQARYSTALAVSRALTEQVVNSPLTRSVIYGIWLKAGLVYIGQTADSPRRLWDLSVGESHHLANTFPCDIWTRVVVLAWPSVLGLQEPLSQSHSATGQALEFLLQRDLRPLFNATKRTRSGHWRQYEWARSRSRAAQQAAELTGEFDAVRHAWENLANLPIPNAGVTYSAEGRAVSPPLLRVGAGMG